MRRHAWRFGEDGGVDIPRRPARLPSQADGLAQQFLAIGVTEALVGGRKMLADVPQRGRAEHRVGDGVEEDIGVGMSDQPAIVRESRPRRG